MNCPVCKSSELIPKELELGLPALRCDHCGGKWIRGAVYWKWLDEHPNLPERQQAATGLALAESSRFVDCPECRFRMAKYLVGHGFSFTLDHCQGCKGIWLDRNEWEALKARNLHDDVNAMLTAFWQHEAQKELRKQRMEQIYIGRFGADDYAEIEKTRAWLATRPNKQELLAYLTDDDPLSI